MLYKMSIKVQWLIKTILDLEIDGAICNKFGLINKK